MQVMVASAFKWQCHRFASHDVFFDELMIDLKHQKPRFVEINPHIVCTLCLQAVAHNQFLFVEYILSGRIVGVQ